MFESVLIILQKYTKEMEGYSYFGSNPGVSQDDYKDVATEVVEYIKENYERSEWRTLDIPPLGQVSNRVDVISTGLNH